MLLVKTNTTWVANVSPSLLELREGVIRCNLDVRREVHYLHAAKPPIPAMKA